MQEGCVRPILPNSAQNHTPQREASPAKGSQDPILRYYSARIGDADKSLIDSVRTMYPQCIPLAISCDVRPILCTEPVVEMHGRPGSSRRRAVARPSVRIPQGLRQLKLPNSRDVLSMLHLWLLHTRGYSSRFGRVTLEVCGLYLKPCKMVGSRTLRGSCQLLHNQRLRTQVRPPFSKSTLKWCVMFGMADKNQEPR